MVAGGNRGDPRTHALDHTPSFVAEDAGEFPLRVSAPESIGIGVAHPSGQYLEMMNRVLVYSCPK